jgi:hypothetical protein
MMHERRKLPRWQINKRVLLKLRPAAGQKAVVWPLLAKVTHELYCQIKDINCVGAQVTLQAKLPLDTLFKMSLRLSENYTIEAKVWVTWQRIVNGNNHYGLYFSEIKDADKDKINKFISAVYPDEEPGKMLWLGTAETKNFKEGGEEMNDFRIFERFRKEFSARFIGLDGKENVGQTFDVSAKGLGLSTSRELESQAHLEIWLDVPHSTDPLYTRGQVVWTKLAGQGGFRSGIELERADLMGISRLLRA